MKFSTRLIHGGNEIDKATGALSIPIYQASTYHQQDIDAGQEFEYSRSGNPTRKALEETIAFLEGAEHGYAFASGMAATTAVFSIFSAGDHIVVCEDVYGGTFKISKDVFPRFGLEFTFADAGNIETLKSAIKPSTKAIFIETPSNPLLKITDIRAVAALAHAHGLVTIIDNTFMSPYLQRPIELGIDIVIHSATKFIGGHSDVVGGLVAVKDNTLAKRIYTIQYSCGAILGPQDCWLLLRGLKTLKVRLDTQQSSALKLAEWLSSHPAVEQFYYPGLKQHEGYELHKSQSDGAGAVLSFKAKDTETARAFMRNVKLAAVAVSLGGVETIVSYPAKMSHAAMPRHEREKIGITDSLIRVSVGLEDIDDLIDDFDMAFKH